MTNRNRPPVGTKGHISNSKSLNYTSSLHSIQQISAMLADNIDAVLLALFPDNLIYKNGNETRIGSNGSIVVTQTQDGAIYFSHEEQKGGNIFALLQDILALSDFKSSLAWAKSFLGLTEGQALPKPIWRPEKRVFVPRCNKERVNGALFYWNNSQLIAGTYAEAYLRNRGIVLPVSKNLRFNQGIKNPSTKKYHPSLVAAVQNVDGKFTAIHYISLDPFTCQKIKGVSVNAKISKGVIKGGSVRLSPDDCEVVVCEGVEDGLSILELNPSLCVWCGLGGNIRNIEFPPEVTKITIAADNDDAGRNNATKLYNRLKSEGMDVSIIYPPEGFKDFNDYLQGGK